MDTGAGLLGVNMYVYCENNPVNMVDNAGYLPKFIQNIKDSVTHTTKQIVSQVIKIGTAINNVIGPELLPSKTIQPDIAKEKANLGVAKVYIGVATAIEKDPKKALTLYLDTVDIAGGIVGTARGFSVDASVTLKGNATLEVSGKNIKTSLSVESNVVTTKYSTSILKTGSDGIQKGMYVDMEVNNITLNGVAIVVTIMVFQPWTAITIVPVLEDALSH